MDDRTTTLEQLRRRMRGFVRQRQWDKYHKPKNLAMSLAIEAAELMEHFQWLTHGEAAAVLDDPDRKAAVADEMADVLAYLLSLANAVEIDLASSFEAKMKRNERKYPRDSVLGHYDHSMKRRAGRQLPPDSA
jgi:NTP pyrophosphatase (non-canonical NTP hydrolase)